MAPLLYKRRTFISNQGGQKPRAGAKTSLTTRTGKSFLYAQLAQKFHRVVNPWAIF